MKQNSIALLLLLLITPCLAVAQRKELGQARTILKSGKKIEDAEKLMVNLLKDSANRDNKKIYAVWYQSVEKQYQAVNEKLYLKQNQDTAAAFALLSRLFKVAESLDSVDARPDQKGRVAPEYRERNAQALIVYRANLFAAGTYHLRKGQNQQAYDFYEQYIDCARQPLFSAFQLDSTDRRLPEAAYWATAAAYREKNAVLTLRYRKLALADSTKAAFTLQYVAEAWRWLNDDSLYVATLAEGFQRFPTFHYFFPRLIDHHTMQGQYEEALRLSNQALEANDSSLLFLYAKSNALLSLERYAESLQVSDRLIALNDSLPEAYYNAGTACLNQALQFDSRRQKKELKATYQCARQYMERYRELAPDEKRKWGPALYRIYFNLNLGKQFDEIDRLLKN